MPGPTSIHPPAQQREMLATIGVKSIRELVDAGVMPLDSVAPAVSEPELEGLLRERARLDGTYKNFIAAGVGERHIPAAVWQLALSGSHELTPVFGFTDQAQGALRLQYELQTMLSHLCGLDLISTAYSDGARALAQAITIACAVRTRPWRAVLPTSVNPAYRRVVRSLLALHDIELVEVPFCSNRGDTPVARIGDSVTDATVLVIAQPNYFGIWEDTDTLTDYAREHDWLVIALVDPFALALVKPPGAWGRHGADLAVGSGQPLG
ncbi:MAG: glycine dehydrogenase, partial [Gammaproteobacteria bacterium]|nr:glycine dehydrogenase [Gammaproteobacteria bacterium]